MPGRPVAGSTPFGQRAEPVAEPHARPDRAEPHVRPDRAEPYVRPDRAGRPDPLGRADPTARPDPSSRVDPAGRRPPDRGAAPDLAPEPAGSRSLNLGFGRTNARERELVRSVSTPLTGVKRVVVLSIKGGVGKTTTVAVIGSLLAGLRRDMVVAVDASSDWGTLAARLSVVPKQTVRELADRGRQAVSEHGIRAQLAQSPSGLYVVGSDPQSMVYQALTEEEYLRATHFLGYVANLVIVDVGAGLQQPFLAAALGTCDQLIVATAATWDAVQSAGAALDWLAARGLASLVEHSLVIMNNITPSRRRRRNFVVDLRSDLQRRARAVHEVPFDLALQPGGRILLRKLAPRTRSSYLALAAAVVRGVGTPR